MKQLVGDKYKLNKTIGFYFKIWILMAKNAMLSWLNKRESVIIFVFGKVVRYFFYFSFLYLLVTKTDGIAGFSANQALFFTATYSLIDTIGQFLFRSVYTFKQQVVTGDFDLVLLKPINPLFRTIAGGPDLMDLITIPPIIAITFYFGSLLDPSFVNVLIYLLLIINGLLISMSIHIFVVSLGIITVTVDHLIMIFRDFSSMGRFPIDIYKQPLKGFLTFIVPVGMMFTVPSKALMGLVSPVGILLSLVFGVLFFISSLRFWQFALRKYTSASS
ncbi:MAG: ABC-2 family transporter protein [Microgenomates group bacterium]